VWYRFALAQLRDSELAADAMQETGLRLLRQLPTFRGDSQLQTWSLGIALNVTRELRRKRGENLNSDVESQLPAREDSLPSWSNSIIVPKFSGHSAAQPPTAGSACPAVL
jgi:RNA polymerase sigma-70 factor (ECF subfamily)